MGKQITVDDDGEEADFSSIQEAIDNAMPGDFISVSVGNYSENVVIHKTLSVSGSGEETIIYGGGNGSTVTITAKEVNMGFFNITGSGKEDHDAGILVRANKVRISRCTLVDNLQGILLDEVSDCLIRNNSCRKGTSGILLLDSNSNHLEDNNCSFSRYAGIWIMEGSNGNILERNDCHGNQGKNSSTGEGHGISVNGNLNLLRSNRCSSNLLTGIFISGKENTLEDCLVWKNGAPDDSSSGHGYGIYLRGAKNTVYQCEVGSNEQGGLYLEGENNTVLNSSFSSSPAGLRLAAHRNLVLGNRIFENGIGIHVFGSQNSSIQENRIYENSRGLVLEFRHVESTNPEVPDHDLPAVNNTIQNNSIYNNTEFGAQVQSNLGLETNLSHNWWGHILGPSHPGNNPKGRGDKVSDDILFEPWLQQRDNEKPEAEITAISPAVALVNHKVQFQGAGWDKDGELTNYSWSSSLDGEFYRGSEAEIKIDTLSQGEHEITFMVQDDLGAWSPPVTGTILVHQRPVAVIESVSPNPASATNEVHFQGKGTDDGSIVYYCWTSSKEEVIYNGSLDRFSTFFFTIGTHKITLKVQDDNGVWSRDVEMELVITDPGEKEDSPGFDISPLLLAFLVFVLLGAGKRRKLP